MSPIETWLSRLYSAHEIEDSRVLQAVYWVLVFGFFLSFREWMLADQITLGDVAAGQALCPPYFRDCERFYVFVGWPHSYTLSGIYAAIMGLLSLSAVFAWAKRWAWALTLFLPLVLIKLFYLYFLNYRSIVEYEYFHIPEVLIFVFAARKTYFLRRVLVLTYLFATTMKFNETWVVGGYFSALRTGMPFVPDTWIPFVTNGVILFEIIGPWALLASDRRWRWSAVGLWALFHLYSITLIGFTYPAHCLPLVLAFFLPDPRAEEIRPEFKRREVFGWALMAVLILISIVPWFVPGNKLHSLQARRLGVQMFDANHQCLSEEILVKPDGTTEEPTVFTSFAAMRRCGPYTRLFGLQKQCEAKPGSQIRWKFLSSVNGGPFYEIINVSNACVLDYKELGENAWIKSPEAGAPIAGYPNKNIVGSFSPQIGWNLVQERPVPGMRVWTQQFFADNLKPLIAIYWTLWWGAVLVLCGRAVLHSRQKTR